MKSSLPLWIIGILILCACGRAKPPTLQYDSGWYTYRNHKYGYEIRYPDGFDLWETGEARSRDGANIRVAIKEFAAPALVLDISVESNVPLKEVSPSTDDFFTVSSDPVEINGLPGERIKYHWKSNGELAFIEIHVDRASFRFDAGPDPGDFYATPWWQIISTFRFVDS
jgi:hypothetical protein